MIWEYFNSSQHTPIALSLILLGAAILGLGIFKYCATIGLANTLIGKRNKRKSFWYKTNHLLMVCFFLGYIAVFICVSQEIHIIGVIFVSIIFFGGAIYVFISIVLQTNMLQAIQVNHNQLLEKHDQLKEIESAAIFSLAHLSAIRDFETGHHLKRTAEYVRILLKDLSQYSKYSDQLTPTKIDDIIKSAPLHDIGKVGIKDAILQKEGSLTQEEYKQIQLHCEIGASILKNSSKGLHFHSYFTLAIDLVLCHHEKWDGSGYPRGLKGDDIPLPAQIMALADVYDALRSKRCYKEAFTPEKTKEILIKEKGKHFSPDIVDGFLRNEDLFQDIVERFPDANDDFTKNE